jgi:hypothetical protein
MAAADQSFGNHARFFPMFHFFAFPIVAGNALVELWHLVQAPGGAQLWTALVAVALMLAVFASRVMALRAQDRVIRLEERLRLAKVLPAELQPRIEELTMRQLVGLRFASDGELPQLVRKVLDGAAKTEKEIKQAITNWRADHARV